MALWDTFVSNDYVDNLRAFVRDKVAPHADAIDRDDVYPVEIIKELAAEGFTTVTLPERYGGGGKDFAYGVALLEEVGYGSASAAICLITIFQASTIIRLFGQDSL